MVFRSGRGNVGRLSIGVLVREIWRETKDLGLGLVRGMYMSIPIQPEQPNRDRKSWSYHILKLRIDK